MVLDQSRQLRCRRRHAKYFRPYFLWQPRRGFRPLVFPCPKTCAASSSKVCRALTAGLTCGMGWNVQTLLDGNMAIELYATIRDATTMRG